MGKQSIYLDGAGHVRELSMTFPGQWAAADLTALAGAPPAVAGSPLSGYDWSAGHSKQVVYLGGGGHVRELSLAAGSQWAATDLTATTGAPPAAAGSLLSGYDWIVGRSKQVVYLDSAGHVQELSLAVGGKWAVADLTALAAAPAAAPGSALCGYQWAFSPSNQVFQFIKTVVYLDGAGHIHQLAMDVPSRTGGPTWGHTDLTARTSAPAAADGSALSAYAWLAGNSNQVVYLDTAGHVHELSTTSSGQWAAADLTVLTGAPPAAAGSPLPGYDWAAGHSKQVVYLDGGEHIRELSVTPGGQWAAADLTVLTGAPPAAAGSALTGYGWAAGHSKQVVYLDAGQHVRELSVTPGSQWAAADLTMLTGAPPTAAGSALSGYRSQTDLTTLYGMLRAQLLSRHFAVGRYFRADHLSWYNTLGVVHQSGSATPPTGNDRYHQCLWSANQSPNEAVVVMPGSVYPDANTLGTLPADTGLFERWRVGDHQRANPLMASGQLMACLAVETWLGIPGSKAILARLLATTKSLFKYTTPPYDGYILRWDPATSDHWATGPAENADYQVTDCCDFLTDPDNPGQFLYCTPQDDPRYVPYMQQSAFTHLPSGSNATNDPRTTYQNARMFSLDMTRYWEPSMDELTGLIAGYSFVSTVVSDPGIQAEVSDQASRLARYLSANAYILVRPGGGFVAQGAAGIAPALEFPFGRVFSRITGSAHPAQTDFEGALQNANMWAPFSAAFAGITLTGPITGPLVGLLLSFLAPVTGDLLGLLITAVGGPGTLVSLLEGGGALKALLLYQASEAFDVYSWPGLAPSTPGYWGQAAKNGEQTSFAVAYLLSQVPPLQRFTAWLWASGRAGTGYALNFPPFLGLTALNDSDQTVRNGYLDWLSARRAIDPPWPGDDAQSGLTTNSDAFASAVAVMLGSGQAEQQKLISLLWALATEFDEKRGNSLGVYDDAIKHGGQHVVTESVSPALNFMSALALAWYYSKTMADAGTPLPLSLGFPAPPAAGATLPAATIPAAVVNAIYGQSPAQVIPIGIQAQMGSWPLPDPLPGELDVFAAPAPGKPDVSAGNALPVTWLYSEPRSFFGNLWGASGTDTIGAGKTVTGSGCSVLGVKLQMIDRQGNPLGVSGASTTWAAPNTASGPQLWPSPAAVDSGPLGLAAGARILSIGANPANPADETVTVQWWYQPLRACRYRIAYLVQGSSCAL